MSKLKICPICYTPCKKTCKTCNLIWKSIPKPQREKHYEISYSHKDKPNVSYVSKRIEKTIDLKDSFGSFGEMVEYIWVALHYLSKNFNQPKKKYICSEALWEDMLQHKFSEKVINGIKLETVDYMPDKYSIAIDCMGEIGYVKVEGLEG